MSKPRIGIVALGVLLLYGVVPLLFATSSSVNRQRSGRRWSFAVFSFWSAGQLCCC